MLKCTMDHFSPFVSDYGTYLKQPDVYVGQML